MIAEITKVNGVHSTTVSRFVKAYYDTGKNKRAPHQPRFDKIHTLMFLAGLKQTINATPMMPMSYIALNKQTIQRAMKTSLLERSFDYLTANIYLPNIPDLTSMDHYWWGRVESIECKKQHNSVSSIKKFIKTVNNPMDPSQSITVCDVKEVENINDESTLGVDDNILARNTTSNNKEVENEGDDNSTFTRDGPKSQEPYTPKDEEPNSHSESNGHQEPYACY
ncbi:unnamed protein product [Lepeophtheirus salmonis]|uniref:(salmon louse) hypothetical protein n=1 Tax=Lepeophtheirus salmonis TaxID=72036 RepID=A0A7R8H5S7_LEPSM|nr:unnamed protein product [Lepeophtheirus salmonis]CAF2886201.1 unnamed protein product [Lepeophtheirus salmonis]